MSTNYTQKRNLEAFGYSFCIEICSEAYRIEVRGPDDHFLSVEGPSRRSSFPPPLPQRMPCLMRLDDVESDDELTFQSDRSTLLSIDDAEAHLFPPEEVLNDRLLRHGSPSFTPTGYGGSGKGKGKCNTLQRELFFTPRRAERQSDTTFQRAYASVNAPTNPCTYGQGSGKRCPRPFDCSSLEESDELSDSSTRPSTVVGKHARDGRRIPNRLIEGHEIPPEAETYWRRHRQSSPKRTRFPHPGYKIDCPLTNTMKCVHYKRTNQCRWRAQCLHCMCVHKFHLFKTPHQRAQIYSWWLVEKKAPSSMKKYTSVSAKLKSLLPNNFRD